MKKELLSVKWQAPLDVPDAPINGQDWQTALSNVQDALSNVQDAPSNVQDAPSNVQDAPSNVQDAPSKVQDAPSNVTNCSSIYLTKTTSRDYNKEHSQRARENTRCESVNQTVFSSRVEIWKKHIGQNNLFHGNVALKKIRDSLKAFSSSQETVSPWECVFFCLSRLNCYQGVSFQSDFLQFKKPEWEKHSFKCFLVFLGSPYRSEKDILALVG